MPVDEQSTIATPPPLPNQYPRIIARFWRRTFGAAIDLFILDLIGKGLGLLCFEWLVSLRSWALLLGAVIAALYYIPLNSRFGGGRTLGKRLAHMRVVGRDGQPIGLGKSAIRFLVFAPLLFASKLRTTPLDTDILSVALDVLLGSVVSATLYLVIFNRRTRQTLHDLAAGTYVVADVWSEGPVTQRIWKGHLRAIAVIVALSAVMRITVSPLIQRWAEKKEPTLVKERIAVWKTLRNEPEIKTISWEKTKHEEDNEFGPQHHHQFEDEQPRDDDPVNLKVMLNGPPPSFEKEADKVAAILLHKNPSVLKAKEITITIAYGFDLGIADSEESEETELSPKGWQKRVSSAAQ